MSDPLYDEDLVNLGYLKRIVEEAEENLSSGVSKNYGSKPNPPYHKGDTWIDGSKVYTCINSRGIGLYTDSDWVTESGAKEEAEKKNKIYLTTPNNYQVGDMWILQSDNDHKSGKKGEILITTAGRKEYNEDDWINMLSYGNISSINELSNNIYESIGTIGITKTSGILKIMYSDEIPASANSDDLWYVTEYVSTYQEGNLYKYNGSTWELVNNEDITSIFAEANQSVLTTDGKIQIYYSDKDEVTGMSIGDLCSDNDNLYRYNGTKWVPVYDIKVENIIRDLSTVTARTVSINTDLGEISQTVSEVTTVTDNLTGQVETINEEISNIRQTQNEWEANFKKTGGNNLFFYDLDLWTAYSGMEEIYDNTEIISNSVSGKGYLINAGTSSQEIAVQNGFYTISFNYKKIGSELTTVIIRINGEQTELTETEWTEFEKTIEVTTNSIKFEIVGTENNVLLLTDLLGTVGKEKEVWTQNPNEIRTDTVTIGKGIKVESSEKETLLKIDADGTRVFNINNNEVVAEFTSYGMKSKDLRVDGQAQISGVLIQQVGNQTWFSSLL